MDLIQEIIDNEKNHKRIKEIIESNPGLVYLYIVYNTPACNEAIRILLKYGASPDYKNFVGTSLFKIAIFKRNVTAMGLLLKYYVTLTSEDMKFLMDHLRDEKLPLDERTAMSELMFGADYKDVHQCAMNFFHSTEVAVGETLRMSFVELVDLLDGI